MAESQPNAGSNVPGFAGSGPAELLIRCLSVSREPLAASREPTTIWNEVVDVAVSEHLAPLLFKRLKESGAQALVPADAWQRLRRAYFTSGDRNTRLNRELRTVLQCLRSAGIAVIVLKGAYLAEAVYGDVALRPMCDADILVPRADLARAEAVLLDMGGIHLKQHNQAAPAPGTPPEDAEPGCGMRKHALPVSIRDLAIELHWTLVSSTGPVRIDDTGLWNRSRPALTAGVEVLSLSPEDLLLHLCLHFCYENGCVGLRHVCDIDETIHRFRGELDWAQVAERAREWSATRHLGLTLHLARSLLDAVVPDDVLERLVPEGVDRRILEAAREAVLTQTARHHWEPLFRALGARTLGEKAKFLKERIFLSRDEMAAKYPASRGSRYFYVYYALRLRDGLRAYTFHARRRARLLMQRRRRERHAALSNWLTRP
jgi:hypothetical protein